MRRVRKFSIVAAGRSKAARITACACLTVGLMADISVVAATSASAATFTCTGSYPEVCLGFTSGGEQAQVNIDHGVFYQYILFPPNGDTDKTFPATSVPAGWQTPAGFPSFGSGEYCAEVAYGPGLQSFSGLACIAS